jgi:dTDP-4-dehydrorhamnose reductase
MRAERRAMLLGGTSQLGFSMVRRLGVEVLEPFCSVHSRHVECEGWPRVNLDDFDGLRRVVGERRPDLVIHCAGICDVDKCETWPDFAWEVNVESARVLLDALAPATRLVYCSSDHVFGGDRGPYRESDPPHPVSVYGKTRCAAEAAIMRKRPDALIVRHGLGIGPSMSGRSGHLDWLRYRTLRNLPTTVISDEVRSVVWSGELADRIWSLAHSEISGIRHVVATTASSRVDLARYLDVRFGIGAKLAVATRSEQKVPHIGNDTLATEYADSLGAPLRSVVECAPGLATRARGVIG